MIEMVRFSDAHHKAHLVNPQQVTQVVEVDHSKTIIHLADGSYIEASGDVFFNMQRLGMREKHFA